MAFSYDVTVQEQTTAFGVLVVDRLSLERQNYGARQNRLHHLAVQRPMCPEQISELAERHKTVG